MRYHLRWPDEQRFLRLHAITCLHRMQTAGSYQELHARRCSIAQRLGEEQQAIETLVEASLQTRIGFTETPEMKNSAELAFQIPSCIKQPIVVRLVDRVDRDSGLVGGEVVPRANQNHGAVMFTESSRQSARR